MEYLGGILPYGLIGLAIVAASFLAFFLLPWWFYHRREILRMRGKNDRETAKLMERIEALEQRCEKLEDQVTEAHIQLADEQRSLDRKLASMIPDGISVPDETEAARRAGERRKVSG